MRQREAGTRTANEYDDARGRLRRLARWLPVALLVLGFVLELATPRDVTIVAPFAAAPLAAAALLSLRSTILTGVVASGGSILISYLYNTGSSIEAEAGAVTIVTVSVLAVGVNYVLVRSGSRLASARGIAEAMQLAVLPAPPSRIDGLAVATRYRAAQAETRVGGDFYAAEETPYGVRLLLGDVRGKGVGAVATVVLLVGVFREAAEQEETLSGVAARLDRAFQREGRRQPGPADLESFSTALLVEISDPLPATAPDSVPGTAPDNVPGTAPDNVPGKTPGRAPDKTPGTTPGKVPPRSATQHPPGDAGEAEGGAGGSGAGESGAGGGSTVLRIVNRGHPGPILLHRGRASVLEPQVPALPLGMSDLGRWPEHVDEAPFPHGAQLLLYTDGLSEARNPKGDFYDPAERLTRTYFAHPEELLETVLIDVAAHTGGRAVDDMALLAVAHDRRPRRS